MLQFEDQTDAAGVPLMREWVQIKTDQYMWTDYAQITAIDDSTILILQSNYIYDSKLSRTIVTIFDPE